MDSPIYDEQLRGGRGICFKSRLNEGSHEVTALLDTIYVRASQSVTESRWARCYFDEERKYCETNECVQPGA